MRFAFLDQGGRSAAAAVASVAHVALLIILRTTIGCGIDMTANPLRAIALLVTVSVIFGCSSATNPPTYLRDNGDLSYYIDQATDIEYPDVQTASLAEVTQALPPITVSDPNFENYWELSLEDCVSITLQNSKVLRGYGTPGLTGNQVAAGVDNLTNNPAGVGTIYNVAVRETEPGIIGTPGQIAAPGSLVTNTALAGNQGVEAALADFDAQLSSSLYWEKTDSPRNTTGIFNPASPVQVFQQDQISFTNQLAKRTATGTQLFLRNGWTYTDNNTPAVFQPLANWFSANFEFEIRQPLLRGRGAFINRMPVVISRIGTDQEIANLETQLQNVITNVEIRYWDLWCAYKLFGIAQKNLNEAADGWRRAKKLREGGSADASVEFGAREQYFSFQAEVKRAWAELIRAENNLRWLMGVANTDGNVIRPCDEPTRAEVVFDWCATLDEAICLRTELRQQKWEIKKRQLALAYSKNSLLPQLNAVGLYRYLGLGDHLANYNNASPRFPLPRSGAWNELASGDYQEFRLGLEFAMPVGFRRELSNVRNAQVKLAQEHARLEDMELDVSRELSSAIQVLDANYQLAVDQLNRFKSAASEVDAETAQFQSKGDNFIDLVDAKRRRAAAEISFYQAICEYNKVIALIHRRKGTTMQFANVHMAEGPWPGKAYDDASENARRRSSSRAVNYGYTRPGVISTGKTNCCGGVGCSSCQTGSGEVIEGGVHHGDVIQGEIIHGEIINDGVIRGEIMQGPVTNPESIQKTPTPAPLPAPNGDDTRRQFRSVPKSRTGQSVTYTLADSISKTTSQFNKPVEFQSPNVAQPNEPRSTHGSATARIQMTSGSQSQNSAPPRIVSPSSTSNVLRAGSQSVIGSGLRTGGGGNSIRRVNYKK